MIVLGHRAARQQGSRQRGWRAQWALQVAAAMQEYDVDGSGQLDEREFVNM